jgi:phage terminase large subunit-like protein
MKKWDTSCLDWEDRIVKGASLIPFEPLFPEEAEGGLAIFKELHLVDVMNRPTYGQIGRKWVMDFVGAIFGSYDAESGRRLISEYFMSIAKKNSKSSTAAGVMLTALLRNWRDSAEFLILAPTVEVANNSFLPAHDMIKADEELSSLMHVQGHLRTITHRGTGATLKVVAADNETVGGKKATGVLIDEAWQFGKRQNAENMFREACGGLAARPEGFVIWLTTQADEAPAGIFKQKLDYARDVRDGRIKDNTFLPVLYEYPEIFLKEKRYLDKKNWFITNPNFGASVDEDFLVREYKKATAAGEESMQGFLAKHLNVEIGVVLKSKRWGGADFWEEAGGNVTFDKIIEKSDVIEIGIDGGGLDDLLGMAVLGRIPGGRRMNRDEAVQFIIDSQESDFSGFYDQNIIQEDEIQKVIAENELSTWLLWTHAWAHSIALERRKSEFTKYQDFASDKDLSIIKHIGNDVRQVGDIVRKCDKTGLLDRIGVDPAGIGAIVDELENGDRNGDGKIDHDRIIGVSQGWRLNSAVKTMERKIAAKEIVHSGSRLMAWCVGNAKVEPKGNAIMITKQASGSGKIDPLMAAFNAVSLMAMNPEAKNQRSLFYGRSKEEIMTMISF